MVVRNERQRLDLQERCQDLHAKNEELEDRNSLLQQELSASQHELLLLNESMQQIRGDQPMANADTNSYESLPTTDVDRMPDEEEGASKSNRLSYSGESTTDSESADLDDVAGASADVASDVPTLEDEVHVEEPVKIVSNVVTESQPMKAQQAKEFFNDGLASLHAAAATGFDKYHMAEIGRNKAISEQLMARKAEEDEIATLGAPPPIPVEQDGVLDENRTPSVGEYGDSDMDEALGSIAEPTEGGKSNQVETTQEIDPSQRTDTQQEQPPTVHSQMEQSSSNPRHSPAVPLEDRGDGDASSSSALRNNTEIVTTEGGSLEDDKACHIQVVDSNKQSNSDSTTQDAEQMTPDQSNSISSSATSNMQNQTTTSADTSSGTYF